MTSPAINYDDPRLYEHLSIIIDEFEKAALRSGTRTGIMITAQGPLAAMDQILVSSDKALNMGRTANATKVSDNQRAGRKNSQDGEAAAEKDRSWDSDIETVVDFQGQSDSPIADDDGPLAVPSFQFGLDGEVGFDKDLGEGLGKTGDYLSECLGCDLRVNFAWQLQPIDLLFPLAGLLGDINAALDRFDLHLDDLRNLRQICDFLNGLNIFCIPDLISILMALKMLLQSYLTFQLSIKIDWTVLLGPILKLILDAIASLLMAIAGVLVAPLDCAYSALMTMARLQEELNETVKTAAAVGKGVGRAVTGQRAGDAATEVDWRYRDVVASKTLGDATGDIFDSNVRPQSYNELFNARTVEDNQFTFKPTEADITVGAGFPTGFDLSDKVKLPDVLKYPEWAEFPLFRQLAFAVREARNYIMDLVRKIILALRSVEGMVAGSLSLNLGNLGVLLFIKDMIALVLQIINLLRAYPNVTDWCKFLEENPGAIEVAFAERSFDRARPTAGAIELIRGTEVVGEIRTCFSDTSDGVEKNLLAQWIADLKRDGDA